MMQRGISTFFVLILVLGGFGLLLWRNAAPVAPISPVLPTQAISTQDTNTISQLFQQNFGENSTPLPTIAVPTPGNPTPTLALPAGSPIPISAADINSGAVAVVAVVGVTPTLPPPTLTPFAPGAEITVQSVTREAVRWQPPPLIPPISRDPLGRDHYWLRRPVDSNANNAATTFYPYGSDGTDPANPLRVHHGIDMPNPIGEPVRAAGSGVITWAADGRQAEVSSFQNSPSYGNVIVIKHDFGYDNIPVYTLYAHLSASFVQAGQTVEAGQVIGQVGGSGNVTAPHLHFEVRFGKDPRSNDDHRYGSTYNPLLWVVPYVGHGVIAGRVIDADGNWILDADVTIRSRVTGLTERATTTYVFLDTGFDVNPDPIWQENFAVADIPAGRYDVITTIYGQRVIGQVTVVEGTTAFIELKPPDAATPAATDVAAQNGG
jgi:murein DD-endopeptidase MepM/ murein hydrolase activator NlpD